MTISARAPIAQRIWRGYDDPGLPVGMWLSSTTVTGDASGGNELVIFEFRLEGNPVTGRFYNVEQVECMRTNGAGNLFFRVVNFESVGPTGLANFEGRIRLELNSGVFGSAINPANSFRLPHFLGSAQALTTLAAQIEVGMPNVLNAVLAIKLQGYIWEPRSIMAEGGLRRPVDSLYGAG